MMLFKCHLAHSCIAEMIFHADTHEIEAKNPQGLKLQLALLFLFTRNAILCVFIANNYFVAVR